MFNEKLEDAILNLEEVAAEFNKADDGNIGRIEAFEDRLEQAGVGIAFWIDDGLILSPFDELLRAKNAQESSAEGWELGYVKLAKRWRVAVRRPGLSPTAVPVVESKRHVRAHACKHLGELALKLAEEIEGFLE